MKIVILKNYSKETTVCDNYYGDEELIIHNVRFLEETKEVSQEEFDSLKRALKYYNENSSRGFRLELFVIAQDDEVSVAVDSLLAYEKKEAERRQAAKVAHEQKLLEKDQKKLAAKLKAAEEKKARDVKMLAEKLNVSVAEVEDLLLKKK